MSTQQRRQIIMRASGINIDLGMDILDKFKERANYYKQYNKNLSKRLVDEDNNLPADSHLEELEKDEDSYFDWGWVAPIELDTQTTIRF